MCLPQLYVLLQKEEALALLFFYGPDAREQALAAVVRDRDTIAAAYVPIDHYKTEGDWQYLVFAHRTQTSLIENRLDQILAAVPITRTEVLGTWQQCEERDILVATYRYYRVELMAALNRPR